MTAFATTTDLEVADQGPSCDRSQDSQCLDDGVRVYRSHTVAMLRRYFRMSIEVGRLPSVIGRECFRSQFTGGRKFTFEDAVIFVHDMEYSLKELDEWERELIVWVVLQDYSKDEAAQLLGYTGRWVARRLPRALDHLSEVLLERGLLRNCGRY